MFRTSYFNVFVKISKNFKTKQLYFDNVDKSFFYVRLQPNIISWPMIWL